MTRSSTIHSIQLLRAVAAFLVALFHAQQAFDRAGGIPAFDTETYLFSFGGVGVHIFFVISGFIMVYTTDADGGYSARAFFRRRFMRIFPIYWICVLLYLLTMHLLGESYAASPAELIGALFLLPGNAAVIIGPAWTLAFEIYFYLTFGLFMLLGLNRGLVLLTAMFLGTMVLHRAVGISQPAWNLASNPLLFEFIAGTAIGWLLKRGYLPRRGGGAAIALSIILFAAGLAYGFERVPSLIALGVPSALLVFGAVTAEANAGAGAIVRRLGYFGDSSYALYLIHILVITLALRLAAGWFRPSDIEPALASVVVALTAAAVAEALHRGLERPLLRKLNPKRALVPSRAAEPADSRA